MSSSATRRHDRNRRAILDAALELIERSGVDGWSMRELADRVDYTVGALYRYVDGKAALLDALGADAMQALGARMAQVATDEPPLVRLRLLGLAYLPSPPSSRRCSGVAIGELPSRRRSVEADPGEGSPYTVLLDAVRAAIEAGALPTGGLDAEAMAYTRLGHGARHGDPRADPPARLRRRLRGAARRGARPTLAGLAGAWPSRLRRPALPRTARDRSTAPVRPQPAVGRSMGAWSVGRRGGGG